MKVSKAGSSSPCSHQSIPSHPPNAPLLRLPLNDEALDGSFLASRRVLDIVALHPILVRGGGFSRESGERLEGFTELIRRQCFGRKVRLCFQGPSGLPLADEGQAM